MRPNGIVIAIDGPVASGKSTTARLVAEGLGYTHLNTGAMYRAVALLAKRHGIVRDNAEAVSKMLGDATIAFGSKNHITLDGEDVSREILQPEIASLASEYSTVPEIRRTLVERQRALGKEGGVVLEGRDIGTIVFPDAELKVFLVAAPEVRAVRRMTELEAMGTSVTLDDLTRQIEERDRRDTEREISPLKKAEDAIELDTSHLTVEEQVAKLVKIAKERISEHHQ